MTKSFTFRAFLMSTLATALLAASCAGGETTGTGPGGGGNGSGGSTSTTGSGGRTINSSGGATFGSGGASNPGSGGASNPGSGGASTPGSGGSSFGSGGATFGSGGATGAGSGGMTGAGSGGAPVTGGALSLAMGYATAGSWKGYAYTFVGGTKATITPMMFPATATTLCGMGSITADTTYASVAGMGFNVNQAAATSATAPPIETVATSGTGLAINVTATGLTLATGGGSQLRAQVKTASGDYCAGLSMSGVNMIPWGMFDKTCWDTTAAGHGAFTAGTAIKAVELIIPSGMAMVGPFNICINDAKPY